MKEQITFLLFFFCTLLYGQIDNRQELLPGIKTVKAKQYGRGSRKGYCSLSGFDKKGRMIEEASYKKKTLLGKNSYEYNDQNDQVLSVSVLDINDPKQIDTIAKTSYQYNEFDEIISQEVKIGNSIKTTTLIAQPNDSTYRYQVISQHDWPHRDRIHQDSHFVIIILNQSGLTRKKIRYPERPDRKEITEFDYFANGKLKRRRISRSSKLSTSAVYMGGPGSDEQQWAYKYDRKGRVKIRYVIVNEKKYKSTKYTYEEW